MASLQGTTVTTYNATTQVSANTVLNTSNNSIQQWASYVGVPTPFDSNLNFVDLIGNTNGYSWIMGYVSIPANQSYNTAHDFHFALSRYGLKAAYYTTNDGLMSISHHQDPNNANINYLRLTNIYNASWAFGHYHVNVNVFSPNCNNCVISSVLTRIN